MAVVLTYAAASPVVKVGRIAGQFAKPRTSPTEKRDGVELPVYRGDIINGTEFTPRGAHARSAPAAGGLSPVGGDAEPAARLRQRRLRQPRRMRINGCSASSRTRPQSKRYQELADHITEALDFMRACGIDPEIASGAAHDRFLHQPRGAAARLRAGLDPRRFHDRRLVLHLGPHGLDRRPHPPARPRPCRVLPRHQEPARPQVRAVAEAGRPAQADRHPQSGQRAGPADADLPLRRRQGRRSAAAAGARGEARRPHGGVVVRSDARQHHHRRSPATRRGRSTRSSRKCGRSSRCTRPRAPMPAACISK